MKKRRRGGKGIKEKEERKGEQVRKHEGGKKRARAGEGREAETGV